jgi:Fe-S cluster assembly iron-binding protein IscA
VYNGIIAVVNGNAKIVQYSYTKDLDNSLDFPLYSVEFVADLNGDGNSEIVTREVTEFNVTYNIFEKRGSKYVRVLTETETNEVEKTEEVTNKDENGNDVTETVTTTETEEVSKIFAVNLVSGTKIEIPLGTKYAIVGGFVEADAENTSVSVIGVEDPNLYVYAGTVSNNDDQVYKVNNATVIVKDSKINAVTGSLYKVKTENINITIDNSDITNFLACGQSWNVSKRKDANKADCNKDSDMVVSNASFNVINGSSVALFFQGGNSGYSYTAHTEAKVIDSTVDYMLTCGSNGRVEDAKLRIENSVVNNLQTTNRGKNGSAKVEAKSGQFTNIFVAGDANDSTVDGFVESVAYDFDSEVSGTLLLGTVGKETLTDNAIVKFVKYSRSANIEIADNVKEVLGDKLIVK